MRVQFVERENGPERLVCEAEIVFEEEGPLAGMKLVGFSLWRSPDGDVFVTFPSRAFGAGSAIRRSPRPAAKRMRILDQLVGVTPVLFSATTTLA